MRIDGERLRRTRLTGTMSQTDLAELAGIDVMTVSRLERNQGGGVRPSTLRKIATALKVEPASLIVWDDDGADGHPPASEA